MSPMSERFEMRLGQDTLDEIDGWRAGQPGLPSRAEAIRRLVEAGLATPSKPRMQLSNGEKLILLMLGELYGHLKVEGEIDPAFNAEVIYGGHYWGLDWKYSGIFHDHEDKRETVTEVVHILDMWRFLESGYRDLSPDDKALVDKELGPGIRVRFSGFDGNNETEHLGIARFMLDHLDRFGSFKGRDLDSHCHRVETYRRMLAVFAPMRSNLSDRGMSAADIISVLLERVHPKRRKGRPSLDA